MVMAYLSRCLCHFSRISVLRYSEYQSFASLPGSPLGVCWPLRVCAPHYCQVRVEVVPLTRPPMIDPWGCVLLITVRWEWKLYLSLALPWHCWGGSEQRFAAPRWPPLSPGGVVLLLLCGNESTGSLLSLLWLHPKGAVLYYCQRGRAVAFPLCSLLKMLRELRSLITSPQWLKSRRFLSLAPHCWRFGGQELMEVKSPRLAFEGPSRAEATIVFWAFGLSRSPFYLNVWFLLGCLLAGPLARESRVLLGLISA